MSWRISSCTWAGGPAALGDFRGQGLAEDGLRQLLVDVLGEELIEIGPSASPSGATVPQSSKAI